MQNVMMIMKKKSFSKCFISAPAGLNIDALISLLESKGVLAFDAYMVWHDDIPSSVEEEIENSDFLVAAFSPNMPNANVLYEIGFARGAKKPIFLVVQDEGTIPRFLKDTVYVRASLDNRQLISFYMDKFLSKYKKGVKKRIARSKESRARKLDRSYLEEQLRSIREQGTEMDFLSFVRDLFRSQGFVVDTSHEISEKGADMSIWVDSLESSFGNPILVEFKMGNLSEPLLERAEAQMRRYLDKTNVRSGLLIYFDRRRHRFNRSKLRVPLVIRLDIYDLVEKLAKHPIDRVLLHERNRVAHGG